MAKQGSLTALVLVTGKCLDRKSLSLTSVHPPFHFCPSTAQPRAIVTSSLSGPVDTSWELPWPLVHLVSLVTVWDHLISSFFWKHPLSIEEHHALLNFPLSVDTTSHSLLLAHVLLLCISWDFSQCCPGPLFFLNNPIYGPGFQYPWHHWFSNRGRVVGSHLPGERLFQIAHTTAGVLNAQLIPDIHSHSGSFGDGGSSVVCDVCICWETLISCWQIPIHQLHQVRVGSNTHIHLDVH